MIPSLIKYILYCILFKLFSQSNNNWVIITLLYSRNLPSLLSFYFLQTCHFPNNTVLSLSYKEVIWPFLFTFILCFTCLSFSDILMLYLLQLLLILWLYCCLSISAKTFYILSFNLTYACACVRADTQDLRLTIKRALF